MCRPRHEGGNRNNQETGLEGKKIHFEEGMEFGGKCLEKIFRVGKVSWKNFSEKNNVLEENNFLEEKYEGEKIHLGKV